MANSKFMEAYNKLNDDGPYNGPDLTKVTGTYSKLLADNYDEIKQKYADESVSFVDFKNYILSVIESAADTYAKRKFIVYSLAKQYSKDDIMMLVQNVIFNAQGFGVIK